jgi:hypothetical protein
MHHEQMRRLPHHRDRREVGRRVVGDLAVEALVDGLRAVGADEQRVAVRVRARGFGGGEIAACADLAFHHHGLPKRCLQVLGQEPRRQVGAAAGGEGHHDADGLAGPALRTRRSHGRGSRGGEEREDHAAAVDRHAGLLR